jgi:thioredoxin reductase (NADPH)
MSEVYEIAIIGSGAAGSMAALRAVLNNRKTLVFHGDKHTAKRSRALWVDKVVNMPLMFDKKRAIKSSSEETFDWIRSDAYFSKKLTEIKEAVQKIEKSPDGIFKLKTAEKDFYAKYVLLSTGIMDVQPKIQNSIEPILPYANNGFIDYCIRCDGHKVIGKISATIGHTETAGWVAVMLHERYQPPKMKIFTHTNSAEFLEDEDLMKLIRTYEIKIIEGEITGLVGDPKKSLEAFKIRQADGSELEEAVQLAFPMLGQIAYNELAQQLGAKITENGNVITNEKGETNIEGFYVAGDLRAGKKYQIYTAWDMSVDSIDDMDLKLRKEFRAAKLAKA